MNAKFPTAFFGAALLASVSIPAMAADMYEPPVVDPAPPAPVAVYEEPAQDFGGWYIRGDVGYASADFRGGDYMTPGPGMNSFTSGSLNNTWTGGVGVGYQVTRYLRTDLTLDHIGKTDFLASTRGACGVAANCVSNDVSSFSGWSLLANAYVDLGTWQGITPYVGAGIGGTRVKWGNLINTACEEANPANCDLPVTHGGKANWRFTYALMAGASYCLTEKLKLDAGYRYRRIEGGAMFDLAAGNGPGFDKGINIHEGRAGLRYQFGGATECAPERVAYQPEPLEPPIYK